MIIFCHLLKESFDIFRTDLVGNMPFIEYYAYSGYSSSNPPDKNSIKINRELQNRILQLPIYFSEKRIRSSAA